ncbi:MAG TPA: ECF-type sigma factor [Planctomycetota bacterium]|nr:ECF-type sigma factor [Planctomycetota bacterium]
MNRYVETVYGELCAIARAYMLRERRDHTLQATALVHEALARLSLDSREFDDAEHFLVCCARAMRRLLVDSARRRKRFETALETLARSEIAERDSCGAIDHLALDEALELLGRSCPGILRIVELRFFAGLTVNEVASVLGLSPKTVEAKWTFARKWLARRLRDGEGTSTIS